MSEPQQNALNPRLLVNLREPVVGDAFFRTILQTLPVGVCWQRCGEEAGCWVNEAFARLAGRPGDPFSLAGAFEDALFPEDRPAYLEGRARLQTKQTELLCLELRCSNGEEIHWRELTMQAFRTADGTLRDLVLTLTDISERKQLQEAIQQAIENADAQNQQIENAIGRAQLSAVEANIDNVATRQLAVHDELTGLFNRRGYNARHPEVIQQIESTDSSGYLCYFDLDRFKQINDELGHAKGDEALVEFATVLRAAFGEENLLVRLGGDEFVAMGIVQYPGQVEEKVSALNGVLAARNINASGGFKLEASAGITYFDRTRPRSIEELTLAADADLYKNKESRKRSRGPASTGQTVSSERS